ncbi:glucoamylase family protein [Euzebyella saccharophila]|uniref:Glucoamylase family protein n=1 Tax=Euzebyella saccharophila TaxID=679664 RepID=A0ABV8JTI5_9FLAO|nr:glucoamylase family protein [Euzebyella saccharophila]
MKQFHFSILIIVFLFSCSGDDGSAPIGESELPESPIETPAEEEEDDNLEEVEDANPVTISDEELLDFTQQETFKFFWDYAQTESGCARERFHPNEPLNDPNTVTIGGTGFGLMAIIVGIERGFISRSDATGRLASMLAFLENADRFHGAWPHWLDGTTGKVKPFSEKDNGADLVETAFLAQGLICIQEYFKNGNEEEQLISQKAKALWTGVEWNWFTQNQNTLYWHWSPDFGFEISLELKGYNEVLITYIMATASENFGIEKEVYNNGWASNGSIVSGATAYGLPFLVDHAGNAPKGGPLFWAHYSYLGLNPNGLSDTYTNYWDVNVNHSKINYNYCVENPKKFTDYGEDCWGLTASYSRNTDGSLGYNAHSPSNDTGIISPTAAISSIPYTPTESLNALRYFYSHKDKLVGPAGFYDAFSPEHDFWVAEAYLAIDQGPIIIMIENYRSGLLWNLFMQNPSIQKGLDALGFTYSN